MSGLTRGFPTARTDGLLSEQVGLERVVYDSNNGAAHCLRPVAAAVFARSTGRNPVETIASLVSADLGETVDVEAVEDALAQLREHALLVSPDDAGPLRVTVSRRTMLRRTAAAGGAVAAAPLISSIVAPTAYAAVNTCVAITSSSPIPCNTSDQCGCPSGTGSASCTPSVPGTCGCYTANSGGFTGCGTPPLGFTGWCAYHPPSGACSPPCADGSTGAPPCN